MCVRRGGEGEGECVGGRVGGDCVDVGVIVWVGVGVIAWVRKGMCEWDNPWLLPQSMYSHVCVCWEKGEEGEGGVCVCVGGCDCVDVGVIVWVGVGVIAWVRKGVCGWYSLNCCCKVCMCVSGGSVGGCGCNCVGEEGSVWVREGGMCVCGCDCVCVCVCVCV